MRQMFWAILSSSRPRQWIKNIALYLTIVFSGQLLDWEPFFRVSLGFVAFCLFSSSHYILNDILDATSDRTHPFKKFRPVAQRRLSVRSAFVAAITFGVTGFVVSLLLGWQFTLCALGFAAFQYLYALVLKKYAIIDALAIAIGYIFRVYAGAIASGGHIPIWLVVTAVMMSLFLAMGKRRAELTLIQLHPGKIPKDVVERGNLYSEKLLNTYLAMFATASFLTYVFFTYFWRYTSEGFFDFSTGYYLLDFVDRKWMMMTIPFVLFGIMRYMQLVFENKGETLEKVITSDRMLAGTCVIWSVLILIIIYGVGR